MEEKNKETWKIDYEAGKKALEKGNYRLSIEKLEKARQMVAFASVTGGEVQMWLITAYQAGGKLEKAIQLCEELITHPSLTTRKKAQDVLYIIKAPQLKRPQEWMSEIPELTNNNISKPVYVTAKKNKKEDRFLDEPIDLSEVETEDNQFIGFALIIILLTLGSLIWFSLH